MNSILGSTPSLPSRQFPRRTRAVRWTETTLLLFGFACLLWVAWVFTQSLVYQSYEGYKLEQAMEKHPVSIPSYLRYLLNGSSATKFSAISASQPSTSKALPGEEVAPPITVPPSGIIGRIEIPRLRVSAVIREGVDDKTLSRAVGHVPETALPGQPGNFGIAAHRDTFFRGLRDVRKGDRMSVVTENGTYQYEVDSLKIVWPENVEVLDPTPEPVTTLVTCYPFNYVGSAPKRFIVRAKQISPDSAVLTQKR